jgi:hypothetical protein
MQVLAKVAQTQKKSTAITAMGAGGGPSKRKLDNWSHKVHNALVPFESFTKLALDPPRETSTIGCTKCTMHLSLSEVSQSPQNDLERI